jgi:hypothetical protein
MIVFLGQSSAVNDIFGHFGIRTSKVNGTINIGVLSSVTTYVRNIHGKLDASGDLLRVASCFKVRASKANYPINLTDVTEVNDSE